MTQPNAAPERIKRRIRDLAREYRESGYRVLVDPPDADVPDFLKGFHPDLIAIGEPESVVIQVKSGPELPESKELADLAMRVNEQAGWRLDLVVSNPRDKRRLEGAAPWEPSDIARHLSESLAISESGHKEAAFLLLWASTEAFCAM